MDDDMIKESLDSFPAVWQRVTCRESIAAGQPPAPAFDEDEALRIFLHDETCTANSAASLSRQFQGDGRAMLQRHAADAKRRLRRLRAEYFIRTGATPPALDDCPGVTGKMASLRAMFLRSNDIAERYAQAAEQTGSPELRELYGAFAADERRCAQELRALLIESF